MMGLLEQFVLQARTKRFLLYTKIIIGILIAALVWLPGSAISSQQSTQTIPAGTVPVNTDLQVTGTFAKWSKVEIPLSGPASQGMSNSANPFKIQVDVTFSGPSGTFVVPAFYDGNGTGGLDGSVWKVRFSPNASGTWTYTSTSSNNALNGQSGTFEVVDPNGCIAYTPGGMPNFSCVGRLEWAGNHYLKFTDGPYWLKGGADDPEDFLATDLNPSWYPSRYESFSGKKDAVDYLASKNVNSMYIMTLNVGGDGRNVWPWVGTSESAAQSNNEHFDVAKLAQWEDLFTYIQSKGMVLHLVLEDDSAWNGFNRQMYYRELVARFGHHNGLYWNLSEEFNENYSSSETKQFAQTIRNLDPYDHPIAVHHRGALSAWDPFVGDNRFDITSFQTSLDTQNSEAAVWFQKVENSGRKIALAFDETGKISSADVDLSRHIVWSVYMGGAQFELHSWPMANGFEPFKEHWEDMHRARAFVEALPFWEMRPSNQLRTSGTGYVFSKAGEVYVAYLPSGGAVGLDLSSNGNTFDVQWFNPRDGSTTGAGTVSGGGTRSFSAPNSNDWVLLLKKSGGIGNVAPVASNQSVITLQDAPVNLTLAFTDSDGPGPHTFTIQQLPAHGTLSGSGQGRTYTPQSGYTGSDSFTWRVDDGLAVSNLATFSIRLDPPSGNQPPVADNATVTVPIDQQIDIQLKYSDLDGPGPFTVSITQLPSHGILTGSNNDRVYNPNAGFVGTDSFRWRVNDGLWDSNEATVSLVVADTVPPTVQSVVASGDADKLTVVFSEPVDSTSATNIANYSIDNGVSVTSASLGADQKTVTLGTSDHLEGVIYTLTVSGVTDRAANPNPIASNSQTQYTYVMKLVISNLAAASGESYEVVDSGLDSGVTIYIDRNYTFDNDTGDYQGLPFLRTANDDKSSTGSSFTTFDVNQDVQVYVAHDDRISTRPTWLDEFTDTGDDIAVAGEMHSIFARQFSAGPIALGGNEGHSDSSMYVVALEALGGSGAAPSCPIFPGKSLASQEVDGSGLCKDSNGNGILDFDDVVVIYNHLNSLTVQQNISRFDLDGDNDADMDDVAVLFSEVVS